MGVPTEHIEKSVIPSVESPESTVIYEVNGWGTIADVLEMI